MATSDFWQKVSASVSSPEWASGVATRASRSSSAASRLWMLMDAVTVLVVSTLATLLFFRIGPVQAVRQFYHGTLIEGRSMSLLLALLGGFVAALILLSRQMHLYTPMRLGGFLHEQRLSAQACFLAGLLLTGAIYVLHVINIPRSIVLMTVVFVAVALSIRRGISRILLYRRYERGMGTRNVLIVGTGPEAHALRHHLESIHHLGYTFKGFIAPHEATSRYTASTGDVIGTLDTLFVRARQHFVDEIFFTMPCEREVVHDVLEKARVNGVDLRLVPDMYNGMAWQSPIEYIGQFPTIPLHCGQVPEIALMTKRLLDIVFSTAILMMLSPVLLALAIAIKLDSKGPVFYASERIGKKGRVFKCIKFRTMVRDAEKRRAEIMHMNERDGVLFKISNDPRITRVGRFLRKYSLDELPQFLNVLKGDMSVVGPRPPIASEVREYKLSHLRRLDVTPGITGLWQVQGRQDPSFDSYISLDVSYIENWSVWLDIKIIMRTVGVVFAGTGS